MARSIDTWVTDNLDVIIRQMESGDKIVQKYISKPLTVQKRKFDLRFIVNLRSVNPLEAYIYDNFWIRLSNNEFVLTKDNLNEYETHFTVMNYSNGPMI